MGARAFDRVDDKCPTEVGISASIQHHATLLWRHINRIVRLEKQPGNAIHRGVGKAIGIVTATVATGRSGHVDVIACFRHQ
ncbi:hypothetical protein D3C86_2079800 [compost metagenome]